MRLHTFATDKRTARGGGSLWWIAMKRGGQSGGRNRLMGNQIGTIGTALRRIGTSQWESVS
jgi:hypothetical protein